MTFYDRETEQKEIKRLMSLVEKTKKSRMLVVTGRRRVGKTSLLLHTCQQDTVPCLYFFVTKYALEEQLAKRWLTEVGEKLNLKYLSGDKHTGDCRSQPAYHQQNIYPSQRTDPAGQICPVF